MSQDRKTLYASENVRDADLLKMRLDRAGLDALVCQAEGDAAGGRWEVSVPGRNGVAASPIVEEFRQERPGVALHVAEPPSSGTEMPIDDEEDLGLTEIYSAASLIQANLLQDSLGRLGIRAVVSNQSLAGGSVADFYSEPGAPKVRVRKADAEVARRHALEFDRTMRAVESVEALAQGDEGDEMKSGGAWPRCPQCQRHRVTECPICHTTGGDLFPTDFDVIDTEEAKAPPEAASCGCGSGGCAPRNPSPGPEEPLPSDEPDDSTPRMWMCSVCDEPFVPQFPNRCEWCGHRFEDGYDVPETVAGEQISGRAIAVLMALAGLVAVGCAYFLFLV